MPDSTTPWKRGKLIGLIPGDDLFLIKWSKKGFGRTLPGIWRVHPSSLFEGTRLLPTPKNPATLPQPTNTSPKEDEVATRKPAAKTKAASTTKKPAKAATADNGAKKSTGRTRGPDKLEGLTEAKKRNIAKFIFKERAKKPATSWPDIIEAVQDRYDWTLPGSMTGRRLLREYGPDNAEEAIIQQTRTDKAAKPKKKVSAKKAKKIEEELEDQEEELDEEEMEEEYEEELDAEEDDDEEDEDEDEEDEEDEEPEPVKAKRVRVTKGRGKKANPSK